MLKHLRNSNKLKEKHKTQNKHNVNVSKQNKTNKKEEY